ncbi:MAG: serine/threonine protein phosphatase [Gemmatimonadetes bacterium]|nr:MAG: serine/threonine protein phosphatase [Gemmatimonadota bacterium]
MADSPAAPDADTVPLGGHDGRGAPVRAPSDEPPSARHEHVVVLQGARLTLGNAQHIGAREEQQDAFGFSDVADPDVLGHAGLLALVADGMGGGHDGGQAARAASSAFIAAYEAKPADQPVPDALLDALDAANRAVVAVRGALEEGEVGTTLMAAVFLPGRLYWLSVGDSRAYLLRDGALTRLTHDHSVETDLFRQVVRGGLDREAALADPERAYLTSYLGLDTVPAAYRTLRSFPLKDGDRLLLCSDGIYGALDEASLRTHLAGGAVADPEALVERIVGLARPGQDNLTAVTVDYHGTASPAGRAAADPQTVAITPGRTP